MRERRRVVENCASCGGRRAGRVLGRRGVGGGDGFRGRAGRVRWIRARLCLCRGVG